MKKLVKENLNEKILDVEHGEGISSSTMDKMSILEIKRYCNQILQDNADKYYLDDIEMTTKIETSNYIAKDILAILEKNYS